MSPEFLLTSLVVVLAPGSGVLYTLAVALGRGSRASIAAAFGCTLGIVPHIAAAITGLAALLHTSALIFQTFKYAGVAYLLFMAYQALRAKGALKIEANVDARSARSIAMRGILINILNPKLSIFFLAFLPQFVDAANPDALPQMLLLSFVFMVMTFVVFIGYGLAAASVRDHVVTRPTVMAWIRRTFAGVFVLLGARLALADH
ncbi:MAG: LysE family translocator [Hyphomicrobiales bacterium]